MPPAIEAVVVTFWIFITVVSVGDMILDYRKRQLALEPLRSAIQQGLQRARRRCLLARVFLNTMMIALGALLAPFVAQRHSASQIG